MDAVLGSEPAWQEAFQGVAYPPPHYLLVFVADKEDDQLEAAAAAAAQVHGRPWERLWPSRWPPGTIIQTGC